MSSAHPHTHKGASQSSNAAGMADTNNPEQLRKENADLREEKDILKKAAAYFAKDVL